MSAETDQQRRQAMLISHAAVKYSRRLRRVAFYLRTHDRLATPVADQRATKPNRRADRPDPGARLLRS
jgi:hypothetical protein